jgi:hypothetical protein
MEDIIKIQIDAGSAVTELETIETAMQNVDTATQHTEEATKSLKTQIRDATNELHNLAEDDPRRAKLIADIGNMRDRMADNAEQIRQQTGPAVEGLNNSFGIMRDQMMNLDFQGLATSMQGVTANIGRINTKDMTAGIKAFLAAGVEGFKTLAKVIWANPLFLIAGVIITIIATFDKWIKYLPGVEKGLTGINEEERKGLKLAEQRAAASQKSYENVDKTSNILRLQGKSEREILEIKLKALQTAIADRKAQLEITQKQAKTQIETAKRNHEITQGIIKFISTPIQQLLWSIDQIAAWAGTTSTLQSDFNKWAASFIVDPVELETELNKTIQENKDALMTMENDYAGLQLSIKNMDKQALEEKKKNNQEKKKEAKKDKEEEIREEVEKGEMLKGKEIDATILIQKAKTDIVLKATTDRALYEQYIEEENAKKLAKIRKQHMQNYITITGNGLKALGEVVSAFDIKDEKRAKKQFQIMKGIQMASALIDTYKAITGALADTSPIPYYMKVANAVIAGATGFAQVAKIAQTQYNTTGGTQGGTGGMDTGGGTGGGGMQAPPIDFSFMQQTGQPNTVETYVLAGNVANALEARQKIIDQSHL